MTRAFYLLLMSCFLVLASCAPAAAPQAIEKPAPDVAEPAAIEASVAQPKVYETPAVFVTMLDLLNEARSQARNCGDTWYDAAGVLSYNPDLSVAADIHAVDLDKNKFFSHTGSDGSDVSNRVDRTGYSWGRVGENLAYGTIGSYQAADIVEGWLDSPGHCKNIMNDDFTEIGLSKYTGGYDFWVHVFARPKEVEASN